eukprot:2781650-Rhodomonas_salina.3
MNWGKLNKEKGFWHATWTRERMYERGERRVFEGRANAVGADTVMAGTTNERRNQRQKTALTVQSVRRLRLRAFDSAVCSAAVLGIAPFARAQQNPRQRFCASLQQIARETSDFLSVISEYSPTHCEINDRKARSP